MGSKRGSLVTNAPGISISRSASGSLSDETPSTQTRKALRPSAGAEHGAGDLIPRRSDRGSCRHQRERPRGSAERLGAGNRLRGPCQWPRSRFVHLGRAQSSLDRLIDQELLREQVRPSQPAPAEQVTARLAEIRKLHPDCVTDDGWHAKLQHYGLTPSSLGKRLGDQIQLMKLVEDRLRPSIQIDRQAVETYYNDQ